MQIARRTNKGIRPKNEDTVYANGRLLIVADGMGGHSGGEIASRIAVESVVADLSALPSNAQLLGEIDQAIQYANHHIMEAARRDERLAGMGTTMTLCMFDPPVAIIGHVGDSRAYLFRNGKLSQITRDHSLVEELLRNGLITPEEAVNHPHRNVITRALGTQGRIRVDLKRVGVEPGDFLLLCSDGLTLHIPDEEIEGIFTAQDEPDALADTLESLALERGGEDNISLLIAKVEEGDAA